MKKTTKFLTLDSPIPETPDVRDLQKNLNELGIIPYMGNNAGKSLLILDLIRTACKLSPTFVSTIKDLNTFSFGAYSEIGRVPVPGLKIPKVELPLNQQESFGEQMAQYGLPLNSIIDVAKKLNRHYHESGNAYFRIKRVTVAGVVKYRIFADHYLNCGYLVPAKGEEDRKFLLISPYLMHPTKLKDSQDYKILEAVEPGEDLIWKKTGRNTEEAVVHIKFDDGGDREGYYGSSLQLTTLLSLYIDYYSTLRFAKISKTDLISKKIITMEGADPSMMDQELYDEPDAIDGYIEEEVKVAGGHKATPRKKDRFEENVLALKEITTNFGDGELASSLGVVEFPFGSKEPGSIDLEVNRDTAFDTFVTGVAVRQISAVNGWAPELTGLAGAKAGIGSNVLKDLFLVKRASTILPLQVFWQGVINAVLSQLPEVNSLKLGVIFSDNVSDLISELTQEIAQTPDAGADVNVSI